MPFVIIGGIFAAIIIIGVIAWRLDKKRTEAFQAFATRNNFSFQKNPGSFPRACGGFDLFNAGHSKRQYNLMSGESGGIRLSIFDYKYTTGSGKHQTTHHQTVCLIEDPKVSIPRCFVRHEIGLFDWLGQKFGMQDIDFDDDPAFSKMFVLKSGVEDRVRQAFGPKLRGVLVANSARFRTCEAEGGALLVNTGRRIKAEDLIPLMQFAFDIRNTVGV
ncbi:MAG: hypothetical protein ABIF71_05805 [Planctomycetota bacterium]